ncbi:hypothetical protein F5148DRAFT_1182571 [Russula earlei]|uniref:Uncharacterized protein n=1 Tax=Russula earlei TaxID=71964 RepID=A0ACC0UGZ7_9AGAM|nr:hypothetical protein F5148DRAFT_1182571 [Russula earlei]
MSTYPSQYYSYPCRPAWGSQSMPFEQYTGPPSLSTVALQDIVEGQQRATNGLASLLSQERTSNERDSRDHKQQVANLAALSQNFLGFMQDVEHKSSALENSIRSNYASADNAELQDLVKDMVEVVANLRRIADGFACATGLRLVPGLAPALWAWVPANQPSLQQDHTSFSATFPQAPHIFPAAIPNSTRSSIFAHSTGPARSVHWPSNLDAPATSWATPWLDSSYVGPYTAGNVPAASSRFSLGGIRGFSTGMGTSTTAYATCPPLPPSPYMSRTPSDSSLLTPEADQFRPRSPAPTPQQLPFIRHSPPLSAPIMESLHLQRPPSSPQLTSTTSQTESVVGSMRRTQLTPITESRTPSSAVPPLTAFGSTAPNGPSPSTSIIETSSTPSGHNVNSIGSRRASLVQASRESDPLIPDDPTRQTWVDMLYPSEPSPNGSSINGFSIPSPPRVEIPPPHALETVRWSSLFPSAPVVVERPSLEVGSGLARVFSLDESDASYMSSPTQSVVSYVQSPRFSSLSEPMTPLSRTSDRSSPGVVLNRLTTDSADSLKETGTSVKSAATVIDAGGTAGASTSIISSSSRPPRNHLAIQLLSFFFESVQRIFKVPASVDLSYNGFEVSFSTSSVPWSDSSVECALSTEDGEHDHTFEIMPAPSNAALHRYIRDLARVRMDLAAMQSVENKVTEQVIVALEQRVKAEQEATQSWVRRVCRVAGTLSIVDPAFSPRK